MLAIVLLYGPVVASRPVFGQQNYHYYVEPVPEFAESYIANAIEQGTAYWEERYPSLKFYQVDSYEQSDFIIDWVKDFGLYKAGHAFLGGSYMEVGLGDSACKDQWKPYHPHTVGLITAHEIGHILGYEHNSDPSDIMSYDYTAWEWYYLEEKVQFNTAPGYLHYIRPCNDQVVTSFDFSISIDDPVGVDVYYVPLISDAENFFISPTFNYYPESGCYAENVVTFEGNCSGVSGWGALLILIPEQASKRLVSIEVVFREQPSQNLVEQKTATRSTGYGTEETAINYEATAFLETDKAEYEIGDSVQISGYLTDYGNLNDISLVTTDPLGQQVSKVRLDITQEGEFETYSGIASFFATGLYTISAYDNQGTFLGDVQFTVISEEIETETSPRASTLVPTETQTLETYYSDEFGFSIDHPIGWIVNDEPTEVENSSYENGAIMFEAFDQDFWNSYLGITFYENYEGGETDTYRDERFLDELKGVMIEDCKNGMELWGYECSELSIINADIIEIDGKQAYRVTNAYTESYPDGTYYRNIEVLINLPIGNDLWVIDAISVASEYPKFADLLQASIDSFKSSASPPTTSVIPIVESEEIPSESIPETVSQESGGGEGGGGTVDSGGGCLIATAAFGSELTPQVQFLRNFRDNHILSTAAGSSFMSAFNAWYYSFSPAVADYEREQPWLQQTVKVAIYPLLGILQLSEKAYSTVPGEYGALAAGMVASAMIGAVYFTPIAFSIRKGRAFGPKVSKVAVLLLAAVSVAVVASIAIGNPVAMMVTTAMFVLTVLSVTAIFVGHLFSRTANRFTRN